MINTILNPTNLLFIILILLSAFLLRKKPANVVATIATSIGILGTFVGVLLGLVDFNENDISGSVPKLLSGLKTAFVSSIVGLVTSVLIKTVFYHYYGRQSQSSEERQLASTFNDIAYSLREIKVGIASSNEDSLLIQTKRLRQDNANQLQQLNITLRDFSDKMVADSTQSLVDAITQVMRDFNTKINEQLGENFKHLNDSIKRLLEWQQTYHNQMKQMTEHFESVLDSTEQSRKVLQGLTGSAHVYQDSAEKLDGLLKHLNMSLSGIEELAKGASKTFPTIDAKINELTVGFADAVAVALRENNRMIESQQVAINQQISTLLETKEDLKEQQHKMVADLNNGYIKVMTERYEATSKQLENLDNELGEELKKALDSMGRQLTSLSAQFVEDYGPITSKLREIIRIANQTTNGVS